MARRINRPTADQLSCFDQTTLLLCEKKAEPASEFPTSEIILSLGKDSGFELQEGEGGYFVGDYYLSGHGLAEKKIEARPYTLRALSVCRHESSLIILPMALGKTYIATALMALQLGGKKIIYTTPTKVLTESNMRRIAELLPTAKVGLIHGNIGQKKRFEIWDQSEIICMTPQTLERALLKNSEIGNLKEVGFVHFDEIHKFRGRYSFVMDAHYYEEYAKLYEYLNEKVDPPKYFAYTGTVGKDIADTRYIWESLNIPIERIFARSTISPDVLPYLFEKRIEYLPIAFLAPELVEKIRKLYVDALHKAASWLVPRLPYAMRDVLKYDSQNKKYTGIQNKKIESTRKYLLSESMTIGWDLTGLMITTLYYIDRINKILDKVRNEGLFGLYQMLLRSLFAVKTEKNPQKNLLALWGSKQNTEAVKLLWKNGIWKSTDLLPEYLDVSEIQDDNTRIDLDSAKLKALANIARKHECHRKAKKMLIYIEDKDYIRNIRTFLNENFPDRIVDVLVGSGGARGKIKMSRKAQLQILDRFGKGEIHFLISTSVGMEGLDFPSVDVVVTMTPFSYVELLSQGCSRTGRHGVGYAYILYYHNNRNELLAVKKIKSSLKAMDDVVKYLEKLGQQRLEDLGKCEVRNLSLVAPST